MLDVIDDVDGEAGHVLGLNSELGTLLDCVLRTLAAENVDST